MPANYAKLTADALSALPPNKQEEVYDFARFLNGASRAPAPGRRRRKGSVLNLVGIGASAEGDIALNHDKYLYE